MNLLIYIEKILDKLQSILHTLAGWVVGLLLFLGDFIGGHELAVGLVTPITLSTTRSIGFIGDAITPMWNNAEYGMHFSRVGYSTDYGTKTIPADLGVIE